MYDNYQKHKSNKAIELKKENQMYWMVIPYSPDLNPIENVWRKMTRKIKSKDITTQSDLIEAAKSACDEIDLEVIENCIDSMPE